MGAESETPGGRRHFVESQESQALLADGVEPYHPTEEQRMVKDDTGLMVVRQGMKVVGVHVGT